MYNSEEYEKWHKEYKNGQYERNLAKISNELLEKEKKELVLKLEKINTELKKRKPSKKE